MTEESYKNHPTAIIQNVLIASIVFFAMAISFIKPGEEVPWGASYVIAVIFAAVIALIVYAWKKTTITFEKDQIVVYSNVIYKKRKTIPYSKIASANVVRTVFNRIFGTTTLQININSATNAARPEASFVFKKELAEELRSKLMEGLFQQIYDSEAEKEHKSVLNFNGMDSIVYGLIGKSSFNFLNTLFWTAYSIISLLFFNAGSILLALFMLIISGIIPIISLILRYCNFKVYRVENTIRLEHGLLQTYRTSFEIKKINAVNVRRPLFARMIHKCCIETEVVGINAMGEDITPLISLFIKEDQLEYAMKELLPEFMHEIPLHKQPAEAKLPTFLRAGYFMIAWLAVLGIPTLWFGENMHTLGYTGTVNLELIKYILIFVTAAGAALILWSAFVAMRRYEFGMGEDMFVVVRGIVDKCTHTVQYDRVQISSTYATPLPNRRGLAKLKISLLSSAGQKNIKSGFFKRDELSEVAETMLSRLADDKYDYRKTEI